MSNHIRRQRLDHELSNLLKSVSLTRRRRARSADILAKGKHLPIVQAILDRETSALSKLMVRKGRVERILTKAKRVERKSQDRKWTR